MQLHLERNSLLKALSKVQAIVERKHTIPILANVKIECEGDAITLAATDMDIAVREVLSIIGHPSSGAITVPVHTLHEIVRKLPDGSQIELLYEEDGNSQIVIKGGFSRFTLPCLPAEEFPNFEISQAINQFDIDGNILQTLLNKTKHAISYEETRYYLTGTYLHIEKSENTAVLRAVATDTHRLAKAETMMPHGADNMPGIILPRKTSFELIRLLEGHNGDVNVQISANKATFVIGSTILTSKLVDGKFPDYNAVIPIGNDKMLEVSARELARAVDLVISVSADKTRAVRLNIEPGKLTISANSEANGNASGSEMLEINYAGSPVNIGFNARYVLDALSTIEGVNVKFSIGDEGGAVIAQDADDSSCLHILMPMQG